ncbi:MAG TPA: helix-turn-helix transcriptional regulator [Acidimicrobiia bacterium]|nr:helix-turn-helix transcriptional regulator [Acidimicrobiia bacterium]
MSERRSTGNRVFAAREAKGLSLRRAARRLGVSPRTLRGWERGREDIPYLVRQAMVKLYGLPPETLVPERPGRSAAGRDESSGTIRIGSVMFSAQDANDNSLRAFLAAVRQERGLAPDAPLAVRASDAEMLAKLLGGTADEIVRNLQRILGVNEREAVELGQWMFRKTAAAGVLAVGLAAGVIATGTFSNAPAATAAEITTPAPDSAAPADPDWAVIGDAAVLWHPSVPLEERN